MIFVADDIKPNSVEEKKELDERAVLDLLSPSRNIDLKVKEIFGNLQQTFSVILVLPRSQHELKYLRIMKYFVDRGLPGVYLTVNKSANEINEELKLQNISTDDIYFVDAVTQMINGKEIESDKISYLDGPSDMIELSLEVGKALDRIGKKNGFVIVDSITTLLIYNKDVIIEKFLHTLSQKIKEQKLQGVFLAAESTNKDALDTISQFCDTVENL